ncbi:hypothetical protein JJL45_11745 [Tamlana sp. s12]|uniref:hypothetical protein n=1 Tax=Tamlana sp. s12 TaxID=1630406 RepID=UPI0007FD66C6|nr:hypothetical protein [Tamlana sp. s12]OBQ50150.1 hypothetical protein VQ01_15455 [Tamlana sp. s12]QQY81595.1 hypothetical protein JJL45_11745 [Tamlana sp. s12]
MNNTSKIEIIKKLGISDEEINQYGDVFLINYLKFHHKKYFGESSIVFLGFTKEEIEQFKKKSNLFKINVKLRISPNLNFVCVKKDFKDEKRINKSKENGAIILTESEYLELFNENEYNIYDNELIFPTSVEEDLRIVKPLSNFNENIEVESFSFSNEKTYSTNLFEQTCDCNEFIQSNKSKYEKGDLRRFCKHLLLEYKQTFAPRKLSKIKDFLIENGYSLKSNFKKINIEKIILPIYFSYDNDNEWCDIYFPVKNTYKKYGYNHIEKRFSYDDKPYGYVPALRTELNKVFGTKNQQSKINKKAVPNQNKGCVSVLLMLSFMIFGIIFFIIN